MRKLLLLGSALVLAPVVASAQNAGPPVFLQGQPVTSSMLNKAFQSVVRLNGIAVSGACTGNSSPGANGTAIITVTCPGAGQPQGANGSIQLNNGGLFSGVTMTGDAVMDANGVLTLNTVPVAKGGTGASTAAGARVNLGISTVGGTGAYTDLTGLPTLGTIASQAMPGAGLVDSTGTALVPVPAINGDATLDLTTGILTLAPVTVAKGGTGAAVFTAHQVLLGEGTTPVVATAAGTSGYVLTSNGPNADPTWQVSAGSGGSGLTAIANNTLLGNTSGFSAVPVSTTMTAMLDTMSTTRGSFLERGASGWQPIVPGTAGNCWTSNGTNADPTWQPCSGGSSFTGTGGVVGVDANGTPFIFSLNNLTVSTGTGSGILSAAGGSGGSSSEFVNPQTGSTYTVSSGDAGQLTTFTSSSAVAVTLPDPGTDILSGWFADYSVQGTGPVTFTPTASTIDGAASMVMYPGQGGRIVSDGTNYFSQRGGMPPASIGPLINAMPSAGATADADTFPVVQSGTTASKQSMSAVWTWVSGHLPNYQPAQVITAANFTLDANTHNGKLVTVTSPITISLPTTLANVGVGFKTAIFNQSGGSITLTNAGVGWGAWSTSSGSLSIPNGQTALVTVIKPASTAIVYASISNTGTGGTSGTGGFPRVSGRYYTANIVNTLSATPTLGRLYAMPIHLSAGTYRGMAFWASVASTAPTSCREALYSDNGGVPGTVLAENVGTTATGTTGAYYNDFTGGDYTAATDINAWLAMVCSTINGLGVAMSVNSSALEPFITQQVGNTQPFANASTDQILYSSTITTYPGTSLAATNSGNFGSMTYGSSGTNGTPIMSIRAR